MKFKKFLNKTLETTSYNVLKNIIKILLVSHNSNLISAVSLAIFWLFKKLE